MSEKCANKKSSARVKLKLLSLVCAFTLSGLASPAQAQFQYLYMGQSLLYPLTRGLGAGLLYGPYNANPFYSTSSFLRRTAGRASQFPYIYPYGSNAFGQSGYRNGGMPLPSPNASVQDGDGMVDPNTGQTLTPEDMPGAVQNNAPNFYLPGPQTQYQTLYGAPPVGQTLQTGPGLNALPSQPIVQGTMPPKAPGHKRSRDEKKRAEANQKLLLNQSAAAPYALPQAVSPPVSSLPSPLVSPSVSPAVVSDSPRGGAPVSARGGSPLADGFVDHLVTKYDGHMGNALGNSDTRNWAKAMGLIEADRNVDSLSPDRIEVMGRILKDNSLDSVSKVDAVRILLRPNATQK